jgi:hypothetical protein
MKRKLVVCMIVFGLVITALPLASAKNKENFETTKLEKFTNCYIEISGLISKNDYPRVFGINMWKMIFLRPNGANNPEAFVLYWYLLIDETASISIYTQKNGELLWQHNGQGTPELRMIRFSGTYTNTLFENRLQVDINGQIRSAWINVYQRD